MSKRSSDRSGGVGGFIFSVFVLMALVPKEVWIVLGVILAVALAIWIGRHIVRGVEERRVAEAAAAERDREERVRREGERRVATLGTSNAERVEFALKSVNQVTGSEAARAGWLGDVDFGPDIQGITDNFEKAHALRGVTSRLAALDKPTEDDRKLLAEARTTIAHLERAAIERVELIGKCAREAQHIDESLRTERRDARVAEQRAELHAKLSAMLYGIEAAPAIGPADSAVEAVMARVQAYREIKNQIQQARDSGPR